MIKFITLIKKRNVCKSYNSRGTQRKQQMALIGFRKVKIIFGIAE